MKRLIILALLMGLVLPCGAFAGADFTVGNAMPDTLKNSKWFQGGMRFNTTDIAASYTATVDDFAILVTTSDAVTVTLPTVAAAGAGKMYVIAKKGDVSGTNAVTIDGSGSETIMNGAGAEATTNTQIDASGDCLVILNTGAEWIIVGQELQ